MRALSGIQPSGQLHLGNYFGAIRQYLALQDEHEGFYFLANYHALTSVADGKTLRQWTLNLATDYLALGLDPDKATIFLQSDVPEVTELTWILSTVTPMGLLERCHAYKEKTARGLSPNHALFGYPVLQASDILIYQSHLVPVGQDQKQHIEVARDLALKLNNTYGELLTVPEPYILDSTAVVPGIDGQKMSKSYDNAIELFGDEKAVRKRFLSVVTDSTPVADPKDPEQCTVYALFKLFATEEEAAELAAAYRAGGLGYGEVKKRTAQMMLDCFAEARERRQQLAGDPDYVHDVLREGGRRARTEAQKTMERVREATGIPIHYTPTV